MIKLLHSYNNERLDPDPVSNDAGSCYLIALTIMKGWIRITYQMMQDPATSLLLHSYNNERLDPDHVSNDAASLLLCTLLQYR